MKRTRVKIDFKKIRSKLIRRSKRTLPKLLKVAIINDHILKGKSPVAKEGKFDSYSTSYKKQIKSGKYPGKKVKPVNLKLTGMMLRSFYVRHQGNGVAIGFTDFKALIHNNKGAGKIKVIRKMLPTEPGETFTRAIMTKIKKHMKDLAIKILKGR